MQEIHDKIHLATVPGYAGIQLSVSGRNNCPLELMETLYSAGENPCGRKSDLMILELTHMDISFFWQKPG